MNPIAGEKKTAILILLELFLTNNAISLLDKLEGACSSRAPVEKHNWSLSLYTLCEKWWKRKNEIQLLRMIMAVVSIRFNSIVSLSEILREYVTGTPQQIM